MKSAASALKLARWRIRRVAWQAKSRIAWELNKRV